MGTRTPDTDKWGICATAYFFASRSLAPAPEKIARLLFLMNLVPPDVELPDLETKVNWNNPELIYVALHQAMNEVLKGLPEWFQHYVVLGEHRIFEIFAPAVSVAMGEENEDFDDPDEDQEAEDEADNAEGDDDTNEEKENRSDLYLWAMRYQIFKDSREMLRRIARSFAEGEKQLGAVKDKTLFPASYSIEIDNDGKLKLIPPPFISWLDGVEAKRIRECEICKRLFWAGRLDQYTCSTKCAKVRRTRIWRAKYPTDYKLQRIQRENERETNAKAEVESETTNRR